MRMNGKVLSTDVVFERGSWLCVTILVKYDDGGVQSLISPVLNSGQDGSAAASDYFLRLFELFEVESFKEIVGKKVTALFHADDGWNAVIKGLKCENREFWVSEWLDSLRERKLL